MRIYKKRWLIEKWFEWIVRRKVNRFIFHTLKFSFFGTSLAYLEPEQELFELDDIGNDGGDDLSHHYLPNLKQLYLLHFLGDYKFVRGGSEFDL